MAKRGAKILTIVPVAMFIVLIAVLWDTDRIGQDPMGNPAYRFMIRIIKPGIITASVALLLGCGLFSVSVSRRNALITGGVLTTLSVLFRLTMSAFVSFVSKDSWTAVFLLFWALACVAALIFLLAAVVRYVAHLVRGTPTVDKSPLRLEPGSECNRLISSTTRRMAWPAAEFLRNAWRLSSSRCGRCPSSATSRKASGGPHSLGPNTGTRIQS